jgi:hypothetical protein
MPGNPSTQTRKESVEIFLARYPDGGHASDARQLFDKLSSWEYARARESALSRQHTHLDSKNCGKHSANDENRPPHKREKAVRTWQHGRNRPEVT